MLLIIHQDHVVNLSHLGKDFTCKLEEVLIHLLNQQMNIVRGFNK